MASESETIYITKIDKHMVVANYNGDVLRTRFDKAMEIFARVEFKYIYLDGKLIERTKTSQNMTWRDTLADMYVKMLHSNSMIAVPNYFNFSYRPVSTPLKYRLDLGKMMRAIDSFMFKRLLGTNDVDKRMMVFRSSADGRFKGLPWNGTIPAYGTIPSLVAKCLEAYSFHNRICAGDQFGIRSRSSKQDLSPAMIQHGIAKYAQRPTERLVDKSVAMAAKLARGMKFWTHYCEWEQYRRKLSWRWVESHIENMETPQNTSSGIRAGPRGVQEIKTPRGNIKMVYTCNSTKGDQEHVCKKRFIELVQAAIATKRFELDERANIIRFKDEIFNNYKLQAESREKTNLKVREFFIPHLMQYYLSRLVQGFRKFERGRGIKIGMKWTWGGALKLFNQLFGDGKNVFSDGDFSGLDTSIPKELLELFAAFALYYIDPNTSDYELFKILLERDVSYLAVKIAHVFGDQWKVVIGKMPSGHLNTSHGNSWIVGLIFFAYVADVMEKHPYRARSINSLLVQRIINFIVYGDDHVMGVPRVLHDIINETGFAQFVNSSFGMEIRDIREDVPLLSVPDGFGNLKTRGIVFLKRYMIKRPDDFPKNIAEVLPYKTLDDALVKFVHGSTERQTWADVALAAIGLAYDSMGTNIYYYECTRIMYGYAMHQGNIATQEDLVRSVMSGAENNKDIQKTLRKLHITIEDLYAGFPTLDRLLQMHVVDDNKSDFSQPFNMHMRYDGDGYDY